MSNTISVNYMSGMTNRYMNMVSRKTSNQASSGTMSDAIAKARAGKAADVEGAASTAPVSKEDMTMEEYKRHIYDQISKFPIATNRYKDSFSVSISDAGFEAMKNDSEYEDWVLNRLQQEFAYPAPAWYVAMGAPAGYHTFSFGATKEELECHGFMAEFQGGQGQSIFDSHADNSFWVKRGKTHKEMLEQSKKRTMAKKQQEKKLAEKATRDRLRHQQLLQDFLSERFFSKQQTAQSKATDTATIYSSAINSYEASVVTMGM